MVQDHEIGSIRFSARKRTNNLNTTHNLLFVFVRFFFFFEKMSSAKITQVVVENRFKLSVDAVAPLEAFVREEGLRKKKKKKKKRKRGGFFV